MQILKRYQLLSLLFFLCANPAHAEIQYAGQVITVSGKIELDAYEEFAATLANKSVSTVVFKNSGGGSFFGSLKIGRLIAEKKIRTVAEGICASACAIAFLGGDTREFSSARADSALMLHPGFERTRQAPAPETRALLLAWIESRIRHPLPPEFVAAMDKVENRTGGVYFLSPSHGLALKRGASVFLCTGSEGNIGNCTVLDGFSAETMHITSSLPVPEPGPQ